jgi:hypothetical protein
MRTSRTATIALLYLSAVLLGLGSAWWLLKKSSWPVQSVNVGAWSTSLTAGSKDAHLYTRAVVAVRALLALGREETMYFIATTDDNGKPLRSRCSYRISGSPPAARWWSVTAYAEDYFLFDAPNQHYSLNATTAVLDAQGRFALATGAKETADAFWLPTPGDRGVVLTLRLYNPGPELQANPAGLAAPSITASGACA